METLKPLTPDQLARAESRLRNPTAGSRVEAAQKFGVDLNSVIEQLRLTPSQRVQKLEIAATELKSIRGIGRRKR